MPYRYFSHACAESLDRIFFRTVRCWWMIDYSKYFEIPRIPVLRQSHIQVKLSLVDHVVKSTSPPGLAYDCSFLLEFL